MIIMADANAKSPCWFSKVRDERGEQFETLIAEFGLNVENKPHNSWTFENRAGAFSNIDITLTNNLAHETMAEWKVGQGLTTSDHNVIYFNLTSRVNMQTPESKEWHLNLEKANWSKLRSSLMLPTNLEVGDDVDKKTKELVTAIRAAMFHSIPRIKSRVNDMYRPWSEALQKLRVRYARRIYQRTRIEAEWQKRLAEYQALKCRFKIKLIETRLDSWQTFVEESMALDVWTLHTNY